MRYTILISLCLLFSTITAIAQAKKGDFVFSAKTDLSAAFTKTDVTKNGSTNKFNSRNQFEMNLGFGYYFINGLETGIFYGYEHDHVKYHESDSGDDIETKTVSLGTYAKYYFGQAKWKPFFGVSIFTGYHDDDTNSDISVFGTELNGGVSYFINENISLDMALSYGNSHYERGEYDDWEMDKSGLGIDIGFSISF